MRYLALKLMLLVVMVSSAVFAQDEIVLLDQNPVGLFPHLYQAITKGDGWLIAALLLIIIVGTLRVAGHKLHDWISDSNPLDKPLYFLFETKIGAWVLNWVTAIAGILAVAYTAEAPINAATWKAAVLTSTSATALVRLTNDIIEWWKNRKKAKEEE